MSDDDFAKPSRGVDPFVVIPLQRFTPKEVQQVRRIVVAYATRNGIGAADVSRLEIIAGELMANVIFHGGGHGSVALWVDDTDIYLQVSDRGPGFGDQSDGLGLKVVRGLCDKLTIESAGGAGTSITAYLRATAHLQAALD